MNFGPTYIGEHPDGGVEVSVGVASLEVELQINVRKDFTITEKEDTYWDWDLFSIVSSM